MNIYLITQDKVKGYDTYDCAVVSAENELDAVSLHPSGDNLQWDKDGGSWVRRHDIGFIKVKLIGASVVDEGVILASFISG